RAGAVRGAHAGGGVVTLLGHAQVVTAARRAARAVEPVVVALGDVEQRPGVCVRVAERDRGRVAGQRVHAGDQRRGHAGAADGQPAALELLVDRDVPGDGGHVADRAHGAVRVVLPGGLGHVRRAGAAARAGEVVPDLLAPAPRVAGLGQL